MPSIDSLQAEFGKDGLTVLLVNITEPREAVSRAVATRGYAARVLLDAEGHVTEAYRVQATPTVYLIGREGMLLGKAIGPRPWAQPSGRALLVALLRAAPGSAGAKERGAR